MADLDDFFAKKDRKKSKGKKFMTTEEIAKKLEETGKKSEKLKKEKPLLQPQPPGPDSDDHTATIPEDEEWKEFEEEKKDYTGLKIQNLTLQDYDDVDSTEGDTEGDMEENDQGEKVPKKKGPWKVIENSDGFVQNYPALVPEKKQPVQEASSVNTAGRQSNYVPPHLRNQVQQPTRERQTRIKTGAPDITNQDFFPTLSAASNNELSGSWARRKQESAFEEVRNSKSHSNRIDSSRQTQSLEIENKFGALDNEHS